MSKLYKDGRLTFRLNPGSQGWFAYLDKQELPCKIFAQPRQNTVGFTYSVYAHGCDRKLVGQCTEKDVKDFIRSYFVTGDITDEAIDNATSIAQLKRIK